MKKAVKNSLDEIIQKARKQHDTRKMAMKNVDIQNRYTSLLKSGLIPVKPIINSPDYKMFDLSGLYQGSEEHSIQEDTLAPLSLNVRVLMKTRFRSVVSQSQHPS